MKLKTHSQIKNYQWKGINGAGKKSLRQHTGAYRD